jgi:hypothetical protein
MPTLFLILDQTIGRLTLLHLRWYTGRNLKTDREGEEPVVAQPEVAKIGDQALLIEVTKMIKGLVNLANPFWHRLLVT